MCPFCVLLADIRASNRVRTNKAKHENSTVLSQIGSNIGAIVGGVIAAVVAIVVVILLVLFGVWCWRKRTGEKYDLSKASELEMGTRTPSKPVLGGKD